MGDLIELAKRVEGLTGPDREVDRDILVAVRGLRVIDEYLYEMDNWYYSVEGDEKNPAYPSPTGSLDAAVSLLPAGYLWTMDSWTRCDWSAGIWRVVPRDWIINSDKHRLQNTPALALTSACLRALASQKGQRHDG